MRSRFPHRAWLLLLSTVLAFGCTNLHAPKKADGGGSDRDQDASEREGGPAGRIESLPGRDSGVRSDAGKHDDAGASAHDAGAQTTSMDGGTTPDAAEVQPPDEDSGSTEAGKAFCSSADDGCESDVLKQCNAEGTAFTMTSCAIGCAASPAPHCTQLYPTGPVTAADLAAENLAEITIPAGVTLLNTDTGTISGGITRAANTINTKREIDAGIAFHQSADGYGVFSFAKLTVASGATLKLVGANAAALVAADSLLVYGVIDARPMDLSGGLCPAARVAGPGGALGGTGGSLSCCPTYTPGAMGAGPGGGGGGLRPMQGSSAGGGGAGFAAAGGNGGGCHTGVVEISGGTPGSLYTSGLPGGSGGGGGGAADGGGGGGAVRLVAGLVITIADGTAIAGVNAGGCGGKGGVGAGGGGSGGSITLEAPFVQIAAKGTLAANGGSGGANPSSTPTDGQPGQFSASPALLPGNTSASAGEGNGGAGNAPAGRSIVNVVCGTSEGQGGGGSAGVLQILSMGPTLNAQAVLSPSIASGAAHMASADVH